MCRIRLTEWRFFWCTPLQEQTTAVDGWNEQISQLTAERDKLEDSLQEITKVFFFLNANFRIQEQRLLILLQAKDILLITNGTILWSSV